MTRSTEYQLGDAQTAVAVATANRDRALLVLVLAIWRGASPRQALAHLHGAQAAVAAATRGRDLALLNRVVALLTPLQVRVLDMEDQLAALAARVAAREDAP